MEFCPPAAQLVRESCENSKDPIPPVFQYFNESGFSAFNPVTVKSDNKMMAVFFI